MLLLALLAALQAGAPPSDTVSAGPDAVSITLYREGDLTSRDLQTDPQAARRGLVMVTESRTLDVPAGAGVIRFRGVADGMIPQTAALSGLDGGVGEQNYDYDLLTPGALAARSLGQSVRLVRTDPASGAVVEERAVIRSAPQGVVLDIDGRIEALDCSGLPERLVFDRIPDGLADRPTLSVRTRASAAGRRTVKLSYLATGLAWSADYVARLSADGRTMDLTGWLTLANSGDTTFGNAPTEVVAGTLSREQVERIEAERVVRQQQCWPRPVRWRDIDDRFDAIPPPPPPPMPPMMMAPAPVAQEIVVTGSRVLAKQTELGDYKLYTLPERTTVAARQVKQVRFLERRAVPVERVLVGELEEEPDSDAFRLPTVELRARNVEAAGLGAPLPAGTAVAMQPDARGRLRFAGQDRLRDVAVGLPLELSIGRSAAVRYRQVLTASVPVRGGADGRVRRSYELVATNARPTRARLELRHPAESGLTVTAESVAHTVKGGRPLWTLDLPANGRILLTYTVEVDD